MIKEEEKEEEEEEEAEAHRQQRCQRKFPANFSRIDRESRNRVTQSSTEVRTFSSLARAGFASWIDRRGGSIGEGREKRVHMGAWYRYGRVRSTKS